MVDECDGCVLSHKRSVCFYNKTKGCPCKICLIKVMCKKACEDLMFHGRKAEGRIGIKSSHTMLTVK